MQTTPAGGSSERLHAMDGLRACMMMLGVVLHSALSYTRLPVDFWGFKDAHTSLALDTIAVTIHTFRMPVFFCLAGFFARLLMRRRGAKGFALNRARRVLLPMLLTWLALYLPTATGVAYSLQDAAAHSLRAAFASALDFAPIVRPGLYHLWFLYYLSLIYAMLLMLRGALGESQREQLTGYLQRTLDRLPQNLLLRSLMLGVPGSLLLLPMQRATVDTPESLIPDAPVLTFYAVFFVFGWLLHRDPRALSRFASAAWGCLLTGLVLRFASLAWLQQHMSPTGAVGYRDHAFAVIATAVVTWLLVFAVLGLGQRYLSHPSRTWRRLADASYTVYLLHFPITIWLPLLIASWNLPALIKATLVCATTLAVTLLAYGAGSALKPGAKPG